MVRHILIFSYIYLKTFTLRTLLNEVVTVEGNNEKFTIEVKIPWQKHSECMLDLCVCVKNHTNKTICCCKVCRKRAIFVGGPNLTMKEKCGFGEPKPC